jgi:DNA-binding GntR family transcriptional regulator
MSQLAAFEAPISLTERAVAALRRDILATRLTPGEVISEAMAAERLDLGKAPIRQPWRGWPRRGWWPPCRAAAGS